MTGFPDKYELERFVQAQLGTFDHAYAELVDGRKRSHWMWFIFPQIEGLGSSLMAQRYAISSANEAVAYLHHPVLGPRLRSCVEAMLAHKGRSVKDILGYPDNVKFQSCMTLFKTVSENKPLFDRAVVRYFNGIEDTKTLIRLGRQGA